MHTGRISNRWIAGGLCAGYLQCFLSYGWQGCFHFFLRFFVPIILLYLLFSIRVLGAGDIKLFSVICCCMGVHDFFRVFTASFIVGAVLSLYVLIKNKNIWFRFGCVRDYVILVANKKQLISYDAGSDGKGKYIHFSIAIFAGYLLERFQFYFLI